MNLNKVMDSMDKSPDKRVNCTFYIDSDVYDWLKSKFGESRDTSKFVRTLLRQCMEADQKQARGN